MAILGKLKEILGIGGEPEERSTDTEVTVEREPDEPTATDDGSADVEEADTVTPDDDAEPRHAEPDDEEPVAEDTEAAASTGSMVDEQSSEVPAEAAEPAEAAGPESDDVAITEDADAEGGEAADAGDDGTPVDELKGIGPAYAERLGGAGIETVAELAAADPAEIAAEANVGEARAETWVDRAKEF